MLFELNLTLHFQIEKSNVLGRYLVATRDLKAGEVLFEGENGLAV